MDHAVWMQWQLLDSAFPAGGFAHSSGLEAAYQAGLVRNASRLTEFAETQLAAAARAQGPFVVAANRRPPDFRDVDAACDAFMTNHVANRASRAQGRALATAAAKIFGGDRLSDLQDAIRSGKLLGHFAPTFGRITGELGLDAAAACRLLMFLTARAIVSSSVRLGIVGPMEGQSIQHRLGPAAERWSAEALRLGELGPDAAAQISPILELLQASHDRLYSRLFQS
jgi:urease accessory protein